MRIVERHNINDAKWNALVELTQDSSFFSFSWYLDATAENWCAIITEDYSFGIALPFSKRLGIETLYTPTFVRYIEVLGDQTLMFQAEEIIKERFRNLNIATRQKIFGVGYEQFVYQVIDRDTQRSFGSQAKRMLQKAGKNEVRIEQSNNYSPVLKVVRSELKDKVHGINKTSLIALEKLFHSAKNNNAISVYHIINDGGIVCLESDQSVLYLKGTVSSKIKSNGGMYLALNEAIQRAGSTNRKFDFGGSRITGVRQFNCNLGGTDEVYFHYKIDNAPFWFKFARRIKKKWSKK